jgi:RNA polymerase sigma factor (sigma-70 family)
MPSETTAVLQSLLDRLRLSERDERPQRIRDLVGQAYERLRGIVGQMIFHTFPRLRHEHTPESVVHNIYARLVRALEATPVSSVADFSRLAASMARQALLDLIRAARRRARHEVPLDDEGSPPEEPADNHDDPALLQSWTEFHEHVGQLDETLRQVFELRCYLGWTYEETAAATGLEVHQVKYRFHKARIELLPYLPGR